MPKHSILNLSAVALFLIIELLSSCTRTISKTDPHGHIQITSISTDSIHGGDTVTVYGKHLPTNLSGYTVTLNGMPFKLIAGNSDSVRMVVPKMAGSGYIKVSVGNDTVQGPQMTYQYVVTVSTIAGNGTVGTANGPALSSSF